MGVLPCEYAIAFHASRDARGVDILGKDGGDTLTHAAMPHGTAKHIYRTCGKRTRRVQQYSVKTESLSS